MSDESLKEREDEIINDMIIDIRAAALELRQCKKELEEAKEKFKRRLPLFLILMVIALYLIISSIIQTIGG